VNAVIENLVNLSRPARPAEWSATLVPLTVQLAEVERRHAAQRVTHAPLADAINLITVKALVPKLTTPALSIVGALVAAGKDLRAALDGDFRDARDALRDASSATQLPAFSSAIERARRFLKLNTGTVAGIERLVAQIEEAVETLAGTDYVSPELVVPERPFFPSSAA
jgi:hypothetical protein